MIPALSPLPLCSPGSTGTGGVWEPLGRSEGDPAAKGSLKLRKLEAPFCGGPASTASSCPPPFESHADAPEVILPPEDSSHPWYRMLGDDDSSLNCHPNSPIPKGLQGHNWHLPSLPRSIVCPLGRLGEQTPWDGGVLSSPHRRSGRWDLRARSQLPGWGTESLHGVSGISLAVRVLPPMHPGNKPQPGVASLAGVPRL